MESRLWLSWVLIIASLLLTHGMKVFIPRYTSPVHDNSGSEEPIEYEPYKSSTQTSISADKKEMNECHDNKELGSILSRLGGLFEQNLGSEDEDQIDYDYEPERTGSDKDDGEPFVPWYRKENVCIKNTTKVVKIEDPRKPTALISMSSLMNGLISARITTSNYTHIFKTHTITTCCDDAVFNESLKECVKHEQFEIVDLLRQHDAHGFASYFEKTKQKPINKTLFVYPTSGSNNDEPSVDQDTVERLTVDGIVYLKDVYEDTTYTADAGNKLYITPVLLEPYSYYSNNFSKQQPIFVNCQPIDTANYHTTDNTLVHFTTETIPTNRLPHFLHYIRNHKNLTLMTKALNTVIEAMGEEGELFIETFVAYEGVLSTMFVPTDEALRVHMKHFEDILNSTDRLAQFLDHLFTRRICCLPYTEEMINSNLVNPSSFPVWSKYVKVPKIDDFPFSKEIDHEQDVSNVYLYDGYHVSNTWRNIWTQQGPLNLIDNITELHSSFLLISSFLQSNPRYSRIYTALKNLNEPILFTDQADWALLLPHGDDEWFKTIDDLKRHLVITHDSVMSLQVTPFKEYDDYWIHYKPRLMSDVILLNCVPVSMKNMRRYFDGIIIHIPRAIPAPFPTMLDGLASTKRHNLFSQMYESYRSRHPSNVKPSGNSSSKPIYYTLLAIEDSGIMNTTEFNKFFQLNPNKRGTGEYTLKSNNAEAIEYVDELLEELILMSNEKSCLEVDTNRSGLIQPTWMPWNTNRYVVYKEDKIVKEKTVTKVSLNDATVTIANILTKEGIIHSLDSIPQIGTTDLDFWR